MSFKRQAFKGHLLLFFLFGNAEWTRNLEVLDQSTCFFFVLLLNEWWYIIQ